MPQEAKFSELCSDLCESLRQFQTKDGKLLSHDDLLLLLSSASDGHQTEKRLGTWRELQQRTCKFCRLVSAAVESSDSGSEVDADQSVSVILLPGEQSFRLSYPSRLGLRLAFIAEESTQSSGPDNARIIRDEVFGSDIVHRWLQKCDSDHDECSSRAKEYHTDNTTKAGKSFNFREDATSNFRVLDLEMLCMTPVSLGTKYVTLSYVWGQTDRFSLNRTNFERLQTSGSLKGIRDALPKTVNDAIDFVKSLSIRYLWIDALCLIQDDEDDVSLGISMMNSIYGGSYFTLVAASGRDADSCLYGSRQSQHIQQVGALKMTYFHSIDWHLQRSIYGQRGWTLQELVLPRRTVILANGQFYFRCREANWCEETWADDTNKWLDPDDSNIARIPDLSEGLLPSFWAYQKIVEDYSRRIIRFDSDAVRAIAGVTRPLSAGMETPLVEGLPGYYLNHFLLFISATGELRRRPQFASFSWAGWQGPIMWTRENYNCYMPQQEWKITNIVLYLKNHSLLEYHTFSRSRLSLMLTRPPWTGDSPLLTLMKEHPIVFSNLDRNPEREYHDRLWYANSGSHGDIPQWRYKLDENLDQVPMSDEEAIEHVTNAVGGFSIKTMDLLNAQHEFDQVIAKMTNLHEIMALRNWQAMRHMRIKNTKMTSFGPRPGKRSRRDSYGIRESRRTSTKDDGRLKWAQKQQQRGASHEHLEMPTFPSYTILQFVTISLHATLGALGTKPHHMTSAFGRIPGTPLLRNSQMIGSLHPDNVDMMAAPGSKIELIVIARSNTPTVGSTLQDDHEREIELLWVLHVVWKEGIAERRGVGQIYKSALDVIGDSKPHIKPILLG